MERDERLFWFDLAFRLGFPRVSDLVGTLTADQLRGWQAWLTVAGPDGAA